ncbi:MAG: histidine kinase [Saprospiraceae bacterium]|nr:histidine kinase [Lewinella sp.]
MNRIGANLSSGNLLPIVFHIVLWTVWIGLPIINAGENERWRQYAIYLIPGGLAHIPLFLINTEWLIPRVLQRRGVSTYLLYLLALIAFFSLIQYGIRMGWVPEDLRLKHNVVFWSIIPVLFATAVSTGYGFITYYNRQEKAQQEEQQERLKSELSFLRSQISPHFMFNILNSIVYLIRSKSDMAERVTIQLSELIRYMLYSSGEDAVSLEKEINYLKNYIDLQRVRFEEDVSITLDISGSPDHLEIDPMLLIPFVENAFKHGVGLVQDPLIDVQVVIKGNVLDFSVRNKKGPETEEDKDPSSGIGLKNVRRRLELLYPKTHQLQIEQNENWYTISLRLQLTDPAVELMQQQKKLIHEASLSGR